jgi:hypothetical protein
MLLNISGLGCRRRFGAARAAFVGCIAARRVANYAGSCLFGFTVVFVAVVAKGGGLPTSISSLVVKV